MRVLDTAALLHWPVERCRGGIVAISQQEELLRVDEQRSMLMESASLDWRMPNESALVRAKGMASETGDLPRLSTVDVDVLALAIDLDITLVTDDYRMKNVARKAGIPVEGVLTTGGKKQWKWILRCIGCRAEEDVPPNAKQSKKDDVQLCDRCGSPMKLKRG